MSTFKCLNCNQNEREQGSLICRNCEKGNMPPMLFTNANTVILDVYFSTTGHNYQMAIKAFREEKNGKVQS